MLFMKILGTKNNPDDPIHNLERFLNLQERMNLLKPSSRPEHKIYKFRNWQEHEIYLWQRKTDIAVK